MLYTHTYVCNKRLRPNKPVTILLKTSLSFGLGCIDLYYWSTELFTLGRLWNAHLDKKLDKWATWWCSHYYHTVYNYVYVLCIVQTCPCYHQRALVESMAHMISGRHSVNVADVVEEEWLEIFTSKALETGDEKLDNAP